MTAQRQSQGQKDGKARQMIRQQISMAKSLPDGPEKSSNLQKLAEEAKKLNVPKDKIKMWLGQDTKNYMIYVDGPNDAVFYDCRTTFVQNLTP